MTNQTKHTPGVWEITGKTDCINQIGIGIRKTASIDPIGCAYGAGEETEANARLIAAAPELLAAVRLMLECDISGGGVMAAQKAAREVIAKLEGRP
jgi:hypothetical protein